MGVASRATVRETPQEHRMAADPTGTPAPPGSINFEIADFAEARRSLEEPPAGINEMAGLRPQNWELRRRRLHPSERALASATISWLLGLPPDLRPHMLCERFPRVGNALAAAWPKADARAAALAGLINDHRGRRQGFPAEVRREIAALLRSISPSAKTREG
jgi:hypothetical protein